ncbi:MAG: sigma-54-dependent Fis family transcriptional regulator [Myxococcales bacterium]|nr:sigma-54-dependent Fis family transcriptional regulator [Myxococcales bacterium]
MPGRLDDKDREFFQLVSRAAYVNPFSEERDELDVAISNTEGDDPNLIDRLVARVEAHLVALDERGELDPDAFAHRDWQLVEHAVLFECFHRYAERIDALIEAQLAAGDRPVEVPFAAEVLARLRSRGIAKERSIRMLSLFWQMRRAYYFIVTSLTGVSPSMKRLREALWNDVFTHDGARYEERLWDRLEDFSLIIRGETGSGKGQAAAAIGRSGYIPFDESKGTFEASFTELFVPINLSQFPESLIESELFGHKKGAFTGAVDSHAGVFSRCRAQGAIFLDEIGEVSIPVQIKLLRVLQDRVFTPVGSHEERRFEGRVIAATHRDLDEARRERRFRNDFYYRLCSDVLEVPPLRVRLAEDPEELGVLVRHLVERIVGQPDEEVAARVIEVVRKDLPKDYAWPGNVRELEQCVRRVLLTGHFSPDPAAGAHAEGADDLLGRIREGTLEARDLLAEYCALLHARHGTYEEVARITGLDRRTVKKYVQQITDSE